jgi:hypothetical protein
MEVGRQAFRVVQTRRVSMGQKKTSGQTQRDRETENTLKVEVQGHSRENSQERGEEGEVAGGDTPWAPPLGTAVCVCPCS